jgi:hypothetical protein
VALEIVMLIKKVSPTLFCAVVKLKLLVPSRALMMDTVPAAWTGTETHSALARNVVAITYNRNVPRLFFTFFSLLFLISDFR